MQHIVVRKTMRSCEKQSKIQHEITYATAHTHSGLCLPPSISFCLQLFFKFLHPFFLQDCHHTQSTDSGYVYRHRRLSQKFNEPRSVTAAAQRSTVVACEWQAHRKIFTVNCNGQKLTNDFTFFDSSAICCSLLARALASASLRPPTRAAVSSKYKSVN